MTTPDQLCSCTACGQLSACGPLCDLCRDASPIPRYTLEALHRYVRRGLPTGDFLAAVLRNDLAGACSRADTANSLALTAIVAWLHNYAPSPSWGSPEAYEAWIVDPQWARWRSETYGGGK